MSVFDTYMAELGHENQLVTGRDLNISGDVQREMDTWDGRKETHPAVMERLEAYWDNVGVENWTPDGTPWSAAFVSYLLRRSGFAGDQAHWVYTRDIINGSADYPGWQAYNIPWNIFDEGIELNVGDVLVRKRSGSNTAGHGDVVYRVDPDEGWAYLVGGNLSDTVRSSRIALRDIGDRRIGGPTDYQIILKKHGGGAKKNAWLWLAAGGAAWMFLKS